MFSVVMKKATNPLPLDLRAGGFDLRFFLSPSFSIRRPMSGISPS
jgi:hypothetical protein